ncbi:hypothetical protein DL93DRAFT_2187748, partial [Clavulina sp. PMI_390]
RRARIIEWEGTAELVAFHQPYVFIFALQFIEIRHIANGKLVQIIQGTNIHCIWDGQGCFSQSSASPYPQLLCPLGADDNSDAIGMCVHAVMNDTPTDHNTPLQQVFKLTLTQQRS